MERQRYTVSIRKVADKWLASFHNDPMSVPESDELAAVRERYAELGLTSARPRPIDSPVLVDCDDGHWRSRHFRRPVDLKLNQPGGQCDRIFVHPLAICPEILPHPALSSSEEQLHRVAKSRIRYNAQDAFMTAYGLAGRCCALTKVRDVRPV